MKLLNSTDFTVNPTISDSTHHQSKFSAGVKTQNSNTTNPAFDISQSKSYGIERDIV